MSKAELPNKVAHEIVGLKNDCDYNHDDFNILVFLDFVFSDDSDTYKWLKEAPNLRMETLVKAFIYGYEIEKPKEPEYYVKVKGFKGTCRYLNYLVDDCIFTIFDKDDTNDYRTIFTKSWLKDNWGAYNQYNDAGLLKFEEVKEDE